MNSLPSNLNLQEKLVELRAYYANAFDGTNLTPLEQKMLLTTLLGNYSVLKQLILIQNADQTIANQNTDQSDLALLLGLYADLIYDMEQKFAQHVEDLGPLVPDVFDKFFDCGYGYIARFGAYSFNTTIKNNKDITYIRNTASFFRQLGIFLIASGLGYLYFGVFEDGFLPYVSIITWEVVWKSLIAFGMVIGLIFYVYGSSLRFFFRNMFPKKMSVAYAQLVEQKFYQTRQLFNNINGSRDEICTLITNIINQSNKNELATPYGTYYSISEVKNAIVNEITVRQREIILTLLGYSGIKPLLNDAQFVYLLGAESIKGSGWVIMSILIGLYFSYIEILTGPLTLPWIGTGLSILKSSVNFLYSLIS